MTGSSETIPQEISAEWQEQLHRMVNAAKQRADYHQTVPVVLLPADYPARSPLFVRRGRIHVVLNTTNILCPEPLLERKLLHEVLHLKYRSGFFDRFYDAVAALTGLRTLTPQLSQDDLMYCRYYAEVLVVQNEVGICRAEADNRTDKPAARRRLGLMELLRQVLQATIADDWSSDLPLVREIAADWRKEKPRAEHLEWLEDYLFDKSRVLTFEV